MDRGESASSAATVAAAAACVVALAPRPSLTSRGMRWGRERRNRIRLGQLRTSPPGTRHNDLPQFVASAARTAFRSILTENFRS